MICNRCLLVATLGLVVMVNLVDLISAASCCQNSDTTSHTKQSWMDSVQDLDQLHRFYLEKKLLDTLKVKKVPENAASWKRAQFTTTDQGSSAEESEDEEVVRRYTLRVKGTLVGKIKRHAHNGDDQMQIKCSGRYRFNAVLPEGVGTARRRTQLQSGNVRLPEDAHSINLHMTKTGSPTATTSQNADAEELQQTPEEREEDVIEIRTIGDDVTPRDAHRLVDLGSILSPYWSVEKGLTFSVFIKSRALCPPPQDESEYESEYYPILNLDLKETVSKQQVKRHLFDPSSRRDLGRQIVLDCQTLWDRAFLENTSVGLYDALMPCCRRKVSVDFDQLGWSQWVVAPVRFDSYYCLGRCSHFGGFAVERTEGPAFYTELMNSQRRAKANGLSACCSPVKFAPMTITVMIGENEQMTQTLEDVVVTQCGCM